VVVGRAIANVRSIVPIAQTEPTAYIQIEPPDERPDSGLAVAKRTVANSPETEPAASLSSWHVRFGDAARLD
jgi:hypothetical protein